MEIVSTGIIELDEQLDDYFNFCISVYFNKAKTYASYMERAIQLNNITSELDIEQCQPLNEILVYGI